MRDMSQHLRGDSTLEEGGETILEGRGNVHAAAHLGARVVYYFRLRECGRVTAASRVGQV